VKQVLCLSRLENGPDPRSIRGCVSSAIQRDRSAKSEKVDRKWGDHASDSSRGGKVLLQTVDRLNQLGHPLVFAQDNGWLAARQLTGERGLSRARSPSNEVKDSHV
jgi:hypothetical protein